MQRVVADSAIIARPNLPIMEELNETPALEMLSTAIESLPCAMSPGSGGISADVLQCVNPYLFYDQNELFCLSWKERQTPHYLEEGQLSHNTEEGQLSHNTEEGQLSYNAVEG